MRIIAVMFLAFALVYPSPVLADPLPGEAPAMDDCLLVEGDCDTEAVFLAGATIAFGVAHYALKRAPSLQTAALYAAAALAAAGSAMLYDGCMCDAEGGVYQSESRGLRGIFSKKCEEA